MPKLEQISFGLLSVGCLFRLTEDDDPMTWWKKVGEFHAATIESAKSSSPKDSNVKDGNATAPFFPVEFDPFETVYILK